MGCTNGKTTNVSMKQKKEMLRTLIEDITFLQKNILQTNAFYQVQNIMYETKKANFAKLNQGVQNLTNSLKTNDNSFNNDMNNNFVSQMKIYQVQAKDLLTKASFFFEKIAEEKHNEEQLVSALQQKVDCLYEFAFKLQLDDAFPVNEDSNKKDLQQLGDLCESVIIS